MSDNPFAEPNDSDRTVVRGPGGAAPPPRPAQPQPGFGAPAGPVGGMPGLPGAASPAGGRAEAAPRLGATAGRGTARTRAARPAPVRGRRPRRRHQRRAGARGALHPLRQPRRRGAVLQLGAGQRVVGAVPRRDLPSGSEVGRPLLRRACRHAEGPRALAGRPGGHLSLPLDGLPGTLPAVAARGVGTRPDPYRALPVADAGAATLGARALAALEGRRCAASRTAPRHPGLGCGLRRGLRAGHGLRLARQRDE